MKPIRAKREGMPMPGDPNIHGPQPEAHGLVMVPDDDGGRFWSVEAGTCFTLDLLIEKADLRTYEEAATAEERQAVIDKYLEPQEVNFDTKTYRIPRGALLGSTVVYAVEEITMTSTLDL